jgi:dTMP kinase
MWSSGQPRFVVLEGMDGAGTTTISGLVADGLRARDLQVCLTAEPTDGPIGTVLRSHLRRGIDLDPHTTALAFSADRADHLARTIRPALRRGEWVVCDRYLLSTLAYQGAEGVSQDAVLAASAGFATPDLTVVLDVPDEVRRKRMSGRAERERYEEAEFDEGLRASYGKAIALLRAAGHRIDVLDATASPQAITADLLGRLDSL